MAVKKERGRFSLRFNISAVVFYDTHFADDPQPVRAAAPPIDRTAIEAIVREILRQEARDSEKPAGGPAACPAAETTTAPAPQERTPEPEYAPELEEASEADAAILGLISSTMEAFRQGR